jgi:hypothetical protein
VAECLEGGEDAGDLIGALFVFAAEAGGEGYAFKAFHHAEFFEDVVNADTVEVGMLLLLALAVRAKVADVLLDCAFFE